MFHVKHKINTINILTINNKFLIKKTKQPYISTEIKKITNTKNQINKSKSKQKLTY